MLTYTFVTQRKNFDVEFVAVICGEFHNTVVPGEQPPPTGLAMPPLAIVVERQLPLLQVVLSEIPNPVRNKSKVR